MIVRIQSDPEPKRCFLKVLHASESSDTIHFKKISEFDWNSAVYLSNLDVLPNFIERYNLESTRLYIDWFSSCNHNRDTDKNLRNRLHVTGSQAVADHLYVVKSAWFGSKMGKIAENKKKRALVSPFLPWGPWPCATWCWACGAWAAGSAASRPRSWGGGTPPSGAARPPSYWNIWPMIHDIGVQQAVLCIRFH